jgi:hypothetical protein
MSVLQTSVSSLQDQPHPASKANSALGGAQFGVFEVNFLNRELRKNGIPVKLAERPFQILEVLLEKAGVMVRPEELRQKLWPHTYVDFDRCINTGGGWRLWGEQYHLKLSGTFPIQTEIPKDICEKVRQGLAEGDTQSCGLSCNTASIPNSCSPPALALRRSRSNS